MKKSLVKKITLSILTGAILLSSNVVWAAEDIKDGEGNILWGYFPPDIGGYVRNPEDNLNGTVPDDATYNENFYGAYDTITGSVAGRVTISGGTFTGDIFGGYANGNFNQNIPATATNNTVNISDGTFTGNIFGGYAIGIPNIPGNTIDNTVNISGGTFTGNVFGGFVGVGTATNNTVTISGTASLENAELFGGAMPLYRPTPNGPDFNNIIGLIGIPGGANTPNILNIGTPQYSWANLHNTSSSNSIKKIAGFDVINFEHVKWDTSNPALKVDELELVDNPQGNIPILGGTKVTVQNLYVENNDTTFGANAVMTLIDSDNTTGSFDYTGSSVVKIHRGVDEIYDASIGKEVQNSLNNDGDQNDILIALDDSSTGQQEKGTGTYPNSTPPVTPPVGGEEGNTGGGAGDGTTGGGNTGEGTLQPSRNDQVLVLGESRAAAVAFTNQGSELIELGLNALARDNSKDTKVFAAVYGNHSEYETGSHVNVNGWSGIVGIGKTNDAGLTVGAFFENGEGNYSTHNIFTDDYIRGDGEACYNGGGFLVRKDNANGVYTEASLRAGNLQNELRNAVRNGSELTGYDIDTFYYGAHVGIGKVIARGNDGDSIDVYGKFIYTHHDGETFDIGGTATKFDSVESERLRLGFRINEVQTNKLSMYYGAAWEYEFNGDAHDKIASFDLETPSLEGSTVIGEIGAHYKASDKWSIDLNGRAYVGQREGFSGSVQANYSF